MSPGNRQELLSRPWLLPPGRPAAAGVSRSSLSSSSSSSSSRGLHWPGTSWVSSRLVIEPEEFLNFYPHLLSQRVKERLEAGVLGAIKHYFFCQLFCRLQGLGVGASCPAAVHRLPVHSQQELLCRPVISYQPQLQEGGQGGPEPGELGRPSKPSGFKLTVRY